jgi:RNA-directed DNA polymerase
MERRTLEEDLLAQCRKLIVRYERYAQGIREDDARRSKRDGQTHRADIHRPTYWDADVAFDPFAVRNRVQKISKSVRERLRSGLYQPLNPVTYYVPKPDGNQRGVNVFPLVETTLSSRLFKSLVEKNSVLMSANSYAYRLDRTPHDAVQRLVREFQPGRRLYVAEFDFRSYFASLTHEAMLDAADRHGVLWADLEKSLIQQFLQTTAQSASSYERITLNPQKQDVGIPQGTSISLFMANVAALDMDRAIERTGVGYVRYAGDTVLWSESYSRLADAVEAMREAGRFVGASFNLEKSEGIRIFRQPDEKPEFASTKAVKFIGYRFARGESSIRNKSLKRIKKRVAYIVWSNLLSSIRPQFMLQPERVAQPIDRDYLAMIMQLRRYIYGGMSETKLQRRLKGKTLCVKYPGVMSYYPLVSNTQQLKELDGWMLHTIWTSLGIRKEVLVKNGITPPKWPYSVNKPELIRLRDATTSGGHVLDLRIPSFVRIGTAIHRASLVYGPNAVARTAKGRQYLYGLGV